MILSTIGALFAILQPAHPAPVYQLGVYGDHFSLLSNTQKVLERYPLADPFSVKPKKLSFGRDHVSVVWDGSGLTIQDGRHRFVTTLNGLPVSPRLRTRDAIRRTLTEKLNLAASGVSGGRRLGDYVYLVARWQRSSVIWLEVLVRVSLTLPDARPEALAVVEGSSFSAAPIEENLGISGEKLVLPVHKGADWGLWTFDTGAMKATYTRLGGGIKFAKTLSDGSVGFVEKSNLGSTVAGTVDPTTMTRTGEWESSDPLRFVDSLAPGLVRKVGEESEQLHWLDEGRTFSVPTGSQVRRGDLAILVWTGETKPNRAWAYSVKTGKLLASWPVTK